MKKQNSASFNIKKDPANKQQAGVSVKPSDLII